MHNQLTQRGFTPAPAGFTLDGTVWAHHYINANTGTHVMFDDVDCVFACTADGEVVAELDGLALVDVIARLAPRRYRAARSRGGRAGVAGAGRTVLGAGRALPSSVLVALVCGLDRRDKVRYDTI